MPKTARPRVRNADPSWGRRPRTDQPPGAHWQRSPVEAYRLLTGRQRLLVQKNTSCVEDLRAARDALNALLDDERSLRLVCEERLDAAPACLAGPPDELLPAARRELCPNHRGVRFERLGLDRILTTRPVDDAIEQTEWYQQTAGSIGEIGVIEPLLVRPQGEGSDRFVLLDGRVRLTVLRDLGTDEADCWVAGDAAASVNSHRHRRPAPLLQHEMIRRALERGVSVGAVAQALGMSVAAVERRRDLLVGVAPEVPGRWDPQRVSLGVVHELRQVRPERQARMVDLMEASNSYAAGYAKCLHAATPVEQLVDSDSPERIYRLDPGDVPRLRQEREPLESNYLDAVANYGADSLQLAVLLGYMRVLFANARVQADLSRRRPDLHRPLAKLVAAYGTR